MALRVRGVSGAFVKQAQTLCCEKQAQALWARQVTLTVPLSTRVYKYAVG